MTETNLDLPATDSANAEPDRGRRWFAVGSVASAVLASSCCVLPLLLVLLGVSGAWIGTLTALEPYKPWFVGAALVFLMLGFRRVYFTSVPVCEGGTACARPASAVIIKGALWMATTLVALAITIEWWAPLFY
ncbi:MAG: mercuric transporter MerT family protein [Hyphomonas sp.]|nr:mercuric transporter MerT family protein [Hyphomonas sp.]